jgi:hypothetical protein
MVNPVMPWFHYWDVASMESPDELNVHKKMEGRERELSTSGVAR